MAMCNRARFTGACLFNGLFEKLASISHGAHGQVMLVRGKRSGRELAWKWLQKINSDLGKRDFHHKRALMTKGDHLWIIWIHDLAFP
jgi:hypothetical protein